MRVDVLDPGPDVEPVVVLLGPLVGVERLAVAERPLALALAADGGAVRGGSGAGDTGRTSFGYEDAQIDDGEGAPGGPAPGREPRAQGWVQRVSRPADSTCRTHASDRRADARRAASRWRSRAQPDRPQASVTRTSTIRTPRVARAAPMPRTPADRTCPRTVTTGGPIRHRWTDVRSHLPADLLATCWRLIAGTTSICFDYRVTGLAAEAAFFALVSLPPLRSGSSAASAHREPPPPDTLDRPRVHHRRGEPVAPAGTVVDVVAPLLDSVMNAGRLPDHLSPAWPSCCGPARAGSTSTSTRSRSCTASTGSGTSSRPASFPSALPRLILVVLVLLPLLASALTSRRVSASAAGASTGVLYCRS